MKKITLLFIPFLLSCLLSFAQSSPIDPGFAWSQDAKVKKNTTVSKIFSADNSGLFLTKTSIGDNIRGNDLLPIVEHYDKNFKLINSQQLKVESKGGKLIYETMITMEGNFYLFYSVINSWKKSATLMMQTVDRKTLKSTGGARVITETNFTVLDKREKSDPFRLELSEDKQSLLLYHTIKSSKRNEVSLKLMVFDSNMAVDWSKEVTLPYKDNLYQPVSYYLDHNSNVHLLGKNYTSNKERKAGQHNYNFVVMSYLNKGENYQVTEIIHENFITDLKLAVNEESDIVLAGWYDNHDIGSQAADLKNRGVYFSKLASVTHEKMLENSHEFSTAFLIQNMSDKKAGKTINKLDKGKNIKPISVKLDKLLIRDDGSISLIGEQYEEKKHQTVKPATYQQGNSNSFNTYSHTTSTSYHHLYHDIFVIQLTQDGEFVWAEKIAKRQETSEDFGFTSSYAMMHVKDKLYFMFNDHLKNISYDGKGALVNFNPRTPKDFIVALVTVDSNGNKTKKALSTTRETKVFLKPSVSTQTDFNQFILFGQHKKIWRFARFEVENNLSYQ